MKKTIAVAVTALLFSCGAKNLESGQVVSTDEYYKLATVKENDNKRFAVNGYANISGDISYQVGIGKQLPMIDFYTEANGGGKMIASFPIGAGKGKNEFYVPSSFTMDDFRIYDNDGKELKAGDKLQVSFTLDLDTDRERSPRMVYYTTIKDVRIDKAK